MKIICQKDLLLQYINIVNKAVSSRTTLPILECILLSVDEKGFFLTGNDLELGIKTAPIESEIIAHGEVAIEAKLFNEIVRRLSGETVTLSCDEKFAVTIQCGSSEFTIMGQSGDDFTAPTEVAQEQAYVMKQNDLRNMIRQTIFSVAQDNAKQVLTGELFECREDTIQIVSVDGYRISFRKNELLKSCGANNIIVPGKALLELNKILSQEEEDLVSIYVTDKHVLFDLGIATVVSRLINGDFINYSQSFSDDFKTSVVTDRNLLIQSLERASLVSRDNRKTPVRLQINSNSLVITAKSDMGTAYEDILIDMEGEELSIAFNPRYLIEALRAIDDEQVKIHLTASLSPCTILPVEGDSYKYLILPLRM